MKAIITANKDTVEDMQEVNRAVAKLTNLGFTVTWQISGVDAP